LLEKLFRKEVKMRLNFLNSESNVQGTVPVDFAYQAEQWVHETWNDLDYAQIHSWELFDAVGKVCVWERPADREFPNITQRSSRFEGQWEKGPNEVPIIDGSN